MLAGLWYGGWAGDDEVGVMLGTVALAGVVAVTAAIAGAWAAVGVMLGVVAGAGVGTAAIAGAWVTAAIAGAWVVAGAGVVVRGYHKWVAIPRMRSMEILDTLTELTPEECPDECIAYFGWSEEDETVRHYQRQVAAQGRSPIIAEYRAARHWVETADERRLRSDERLPGHRPSCSRRDFKVVDLFKQPGIRISGLKQGYKGFKLLGV